jgi:hypothetical protein
MAKGNGFGRLKVSRSENMSAYDDLPAELRIFVASLPAKLSVPHFVKRWRSAALRGVSMECFKDRERTRLAKAIAPTPTPNMEK